MAQDVSRSRQLSPSIRADAKSRALAFHMSCSNSSLLATCRYSDMVVYPSVCATRAIDTDSKPSALAISMAVSTIVAASRFGLGPREAGDRRPHSALSPGGRTTSAMDLLCMNDVAAILALTVYGAYYYVYGIYS